MTVFWFCKKMIKEGKCIKDLVKDNEYCVPIAKENRCIIERSD